MEYRLNEVGCPHCGNQALELKNNKQSKSIWKQLFAWLKCRNENMLLKFYYRAHSKKMIKEMRPDKLQTITTQNFRDLGRDFNVVLPEKFL